MRITVITINYNNLSGLKDTFRSVLEQNFQDFEYIVIDGGSTDGSKELIEGYSSRLKYWVSEKDGGVYSAMNKGIAQAQGDYVIHMNSGDTFYSKDTLEQALPFLQTGEDVICGNSYFVNDFKKSGVYLWKAPCEVSFRFFCGDTLNHQSMFIKRELFNKVGLYREDYKSASDWLFLLQAFAFHGATYKALGIIVSKYDRSGFSTVNWQVGFREQQEIINKHFQFFYYEGSGKDIEFFYPFWPNFKKNLKKMTKMILPHGLVRYIEIYKAKKRKAGLV